MALTFDLVQALNNVGNGGQAVFGSFSVGTYTGGGHNYNTYSVFDRYGYVSGPAYVIGSPFNSNSELGWMRSAAGLTYPHLAIENINGNSEISSNLWNETIYFHAGVDNGGTDWQTGDSKPCVIRFTVPYDGNISGLGNFLKGSLFYNVKVGWTVLKNGTPLNPRIVANQGDNIPISFSTPVVAGDIIDFVADIADDGSSSDDSAITLSITLDLDKTPKPTLTTSPISCSSAELSGTVEFTQSGDVTLKNSFGAVLGTATITPISGTVNGSWSMTGLNLTSYPNATLSLFAESLPSVISDATTLVVENIGCTGCDIPTVTSGTVYCSTAAINGFVSCFSSTDKVRLAFADNSVLLETTLDFSGGFSLAPLNLVSFKGLSMYLVLIDSLGVEIGDRTYITVGDIGCLEEDYASVPVITAMDLCKKKCDYQMTLTGTADFQGEILIFKAPYDSENPTLVATAISNGTTWEASSSSFEPKAKYIAIGVRHDGIEGGEVAIDATQSCDKECVLVGTFKGVAGGISMGILNVYTVPFSTANLPIATTKIVNGVWEVKSDVLLEDTEYVLYAIKLNTV